MSFVQANSSTEPRALSLGVIRMQIVTFTAASGDTAGTITADKLTTITDIVVSGGSIQLTAAPTLSGNTATLAFAAVGAAGAAGTALVFGK